MVQSGGQGRPANANWTSVARECLNYVPIIQGSSHYGAGLLASRDGLVITNAHVAESDTLTIELKDTTKVKALAVYEHKTLDLAVVKAAIRTQDYFDLPDRLAYDYEAGDEVLAIGHPRGLTFSVATGVISSQDHRTMDDQVFVQTDVAINPGNSGGPLLDSKGRLVGINTSTMRESHGLGFAIPVGEVYAFWNDFVYNANRQGRRAIPTDEEISSRTRPLTPAELIQAAAPLAGVHIESDVKAGRVDRDGSYWATSASGREFGVTIDDHVFLLERHIGNYQSHNPALPLQLLRWQGEFDYVRFKVTAGNGVSFWCSRNFEDLDVSEAALALGEMAKATEAYEDVARQALND